MHSWTIPTPDDFSFKEVCWFLDRDYDDCLHCIENQVITKLLRFQQHDQLVQISAQKQQLEVHLLQGTYHDQLGKVIIDYILEWFDLKRDLSPFYHQLRQNDALAQQVMKHQGLRLISIIDLFEALSWAIIGQQINLRFAYQLKRNLVQRYGASQTFQNQIHYLFPSPEKIAGSTVEELKKLKLSTRKSEYLIGIAERMVKGDLSKRKLLDLAHTSSMITELCNIRGIGEWTANYALMKCLKRMDAVPYGDAGLIKAIQLVNQMEQRPSREEQVLFFKELAGWEAYTTFYLWQSLSV
ncbi:MAG: DNA-3-methyladenine glycosylase family protein [Flammeovirgaceae bacterium]